MSGEKAGTNRQGSKDRRTRPGTERARTVIEVPDTWERAMLTAMADRSAQQASSETNCMPATLFSSRPASPTAHQNGKRTSLASPTRFVTVRIAGAKRKAIDVARKMIFEIWRVTLEAMSQGPRVNPTG